MRKCYRELGREAGSVELALQSEIHYPNKQRGKKARILKEISLAPSLCCHKNTHKKTSALA